MPSLRAALKTLPFQNGVVAAVALNLLLIIVLFIFKGKLPPQVPLFYGQARGEEQLVGSTALAIPAMASLAIILFNSLICLVFVKDNFLAKTLMVAAIATALFAAITIVRISLLVGNF